MQALAKFELEINKKQKFYFSTLACITLIVLYPSERINIVGVVFAYVVCSFILYLFLKKLSVSNKSITINWFYVFQIKLFVTLILASIFVFLPLGTDISTSEQVPALIDATYYNYLAKTLANEGIFKNIELAYSGWQTGGIVITTSIIYKIFSSSTLTVIIVNCLLITLSSLFIFLLANSCFKKIGSQRLFYLLPFAPMETSYDTVPSKEVWSLFLVIGIVYLFFLLSKKIKPGYIIFLFAAAYLLFIIRLNLLGSIIVGGILFLFFFRASIKKILVSSVFVSVLVFLSLSTKVVGDIVMRYLDFGIINAMIDIKETNSGLKKVIIDTFSATSLAKMIGFLPIRAIIFLFLPFPILFFSPDYIADFLNNQLVEKDKYYLFHFYVEGSAKLDAFLMLLFFPFFLNFIFQLKKIIIDSFGFFFLFFFLFMLLSISTFNFVEGTRYRALIEPFYYAMAFSGFSYKFSSLLKQTSIFWYIILILFPSIIWVSQIFN